MATAPLFAEVCEPRIHRDAQGDQITRETAKALADWEADRSSGVSTIIVLFTQQLSNEQLEFLVESPRTQDNRERRARIARTHASAAQDRVRGWLHNDPWVRDVLHRRGLCGVMSPSQVKSLPFFNCLICPGTSELVERLFEFPEVLAIARDFTISPIRPRVATTPHEQLESLATSGEPFEHRDGFTWGWHRLGLPTVQTDGHNGNGALIGIADTGVYDMHPELNGKILDFAKVQPGGTLQPAHSFDPAGHGTAMAGIIVGGRESGPAIGGAPQAKLKVVSVIDGERGLVSSLLVGLDWLCDQYRAVDVINMSVGVRRWSQSVSALGELLRNANFQRVTLVAAIGNRPGESMYPAAFPDVLSCGAIAVNGEVWDGSGKDPDLVLPGCSVYSCVPPLHPETDGLSYAWCTGSSCAAAHLSALCGLLSRARPEASPFALRQSLIRTAHGAGGKPELWGNGIPNFHRALDYLDLHL